MLSPGVSKCDNCGVVHLEPNARDMGLAILVEVSVEKFKKLCGNCNRFYERKAEEKRRLENAELKRKQMSLF